MDGTAEGCSPHYGCPHWSMGASSIVGLSPQSHPHPHIYPFPPQCVILSGLTVICLLFVANYNLGKKLSIMRLSQIKVFADALSLSFFNSEETVGNEISSCLSHRATSGEEGRGPNWYVTGRMLRPPSQMGIIVTPASANAQTSRQLCSFFLSSEPGPPCWIDLINNFHCQKHISPSHSGCC